MIKAILIHTTGKIELVEIESFDHMKQLSKIQWAECINFGPTANMYLDEDGKMKQLTINHIASSLCTKYNIGLAKDDLIVGNAVITGRPDKTGNWTSIPNELAEELLKTSS